jgi:hypothetical protein
MTHTHPPLVISSGEAIQQLPLVEDQIDFLLEEVNRLEHARLSFSRFYGDDDDGQTWEHMLSSLPHFDETHPFPFSAYLENRKALRSALERRVLYLSEQIRFLQSDLTSLDGLMMQEPSDKSPEELAPALRR